MFLGSKVKNYFSFDHFFKKLFSMKNQKSTTKMKYASEKRSLKYIGRTYKRLLYMRKYTHLYILC